MSGSTKWYMNPMEYYSAIKWNKLLIHNGMQDSEMHYAKQKEPDSNDIHCMSYIFLRKGKIIGVDNKSGVAEVHGRVWL